MWFMDHSARLTSRQMYVRERVETSKPNKAGIYCRFFVYAFIAVNMQHLAYMPCGKQRSADVSKGFFSSFHFTLSTLDSNEA